MVLKEVFERYRAKDGSLREARSGSLEGEVQRVLQADSELFRLVGYKVLRIRSGLVEMSFPYSRAIARRGEMVHGGVTMYTLDSVCGLAVMSANPGGDQLTLDLNVSFLEPLKKAPFLARGTVIRAGRSTAVAEGEIRDADGHLCAKSLGTFYLGSKKVKR